VVLRFPILGGEDTPDFGHAFSNRTHFQACGRFWLNSIQRAQRVADERKIEKEDRIVVKLKSTNEYVGIVRRSKNVQKTYIAHMPIHKNWTVPTTVHNQGTQCSTLQIR